MPTISQKRVLTPNEVESTMLLFEVAASSAGSMQRRDSPNSSANAFFDQMTAILPRQFDGSC
jgi:hypothetical protein